MRSPSLQLRRSRLTGLPSLSAERLKIEPDDLRDLESELIERFDEIVAEGIGSTVVSTATVPGVPRPTRLLIEEIDHSRSRRCPDLVFRLVDWPESKVVDWRQLSGLLEELSLGQASKPLASIIAEFLALEQEPRSYQALLLASSYIVMQMWLARPNECKRLRALESALTELLSFREATPANG